MDQLHPQAEQMEDASMVRTLAHQAAAIWPQELPLLRRYQLPAAPQILDAGCGTGEASRRLLAAFPGGSVLGVDVLEAQVARARAATKADARIRFDQGSIFELEQPDGAFDLTVCRHVIHAIPRAERALAELVRVTRPGGWVHLVAEDYGMVHFPRRHLDAVAFWSQVPARFGAATGTDVFIGRRTPALLRALGLTSVSLEYVVVDTARVPRETFAGIWEAWRDGYVDPIAQHCGLPAAEVAAHFEDQLATLRDPAAYAAWLVPVVAGQRPGAASRA